MPEGTDESPEGTDESPKAMTVAKMCSRCGEVKPATTEYFQRDKQRSDGLRYACKTCRREEKKQEKAKEFVSAAEQLDEKAAELLEQVISTDGDISPASLGAIAEQGFEIFGGATGIMARMQAEMLAAPPGSPTRLRYMTLLVSLIEKAEAKDAISQPSELWSDDELDEEMDKKIFKLAKRYVGRDRSRKIQKAHDERSDAV